jgi:hypothetical protein
VGVGEFGEIKGVECVRVVIHGSRSEGSGLFLLSGLGTLSWPWYVIITVTS